MACVCFCVLWTTIMFSTTCCCGKWFVSILLCVNSCCFVLLSCEAFFVGTRIRVKLECVCVCMLQSDNIAMKNESFIYLLSRCQTQSICLFERARSRILRPSSSYTANSITALFESHACSRITNLSTGMHCCNAGRPLPKLVLRPSPLLEVQ